MNYKHTQIGHLIIFVLIAVGALYGYLFYTIEFEREILIVMIAILALIASSISLTVEVNQKYLRLKFGYGIFRKKFALKDIASAKAVRNHWYYGWGIRVWFWPRMIIFNVSGFDAIEIKTTKGKTYRIGTDEPARLEDAIIQRITR